jgi:hypothetical protein
MDVRRLNWCMVALAIKSVSDKTSKMTTEKELKPTPCSGVYQVQQNHRCLRTLWERAR